MSLPEIIIIINPAHIGIVIFFTVLIVRAHNAWLEDDEDDD